jgi:hypothetical protein
MATRRGTATRTKDEGGEQAEPTSETAESPTAPFERAYYSYFTTVTSTLADPDLSQRITDAANDCLRTYYDNQLPQDVWQGMSDAWERASRTYGADPVQPAERMSTVLEANATVSQLLERAQRDRQERLAAAYSHYVDLVQQAPRAVSERANDAFREYVGELRTAWSAADVDALQPEDLLAIGQSVVQVCAGQMVLKTTVPS